MTDLGLAILDGFSIIVGCLLLISNQQMHYEDKRLKKVFSYMIVFNIISLLTHAIYYAKFLSLPPMLRIADDILLIVSFYIVELLFAEYVLSNLKEINKRNQLVRILIHLGVTICIVAWVLQAVHVIDINDTKFFYIGQIPGWIITIEIIYLILSNYKELGERHSIYLLLYLLIPMIGMLLRNITNISGLQHAFTTISLLLLHLIINTEQSRQLQEEKHENEVNKRRIMLTQIKPHFIYNSLNTIYYLCEKDPKEAQNAIAEFSDYLRGNLDSLTKDELIPFRKELEHIHHYLYLEQLRYSDDLNIEMDIRYREFYVPALSIQLLVENAVKHGIGHKKDGGTVKIASWEEPDACVVTVSDDGVGFNAMNVPQTGDERSHIGLKSMQSRIQNAGGTVTIDSKINKGTVVTVRMPKPAES